MDQTKPKLPPLASTLYTIAVIGLSVFLMHGWGVLWAACILAFWVCFTFDSSKKKLRLSTVILYSFMLAWVVGGVFLGGLSFVPASDIDKTGRYHAAHDIKQLTLATVNFESTHQHLPPAYKTDANGRPAHSWRVLVLPFLSDHGAEIYKQYRMDEAWDSSHNLAVAGRLNESLFGDHSDPTLATYKLVSGPGTPFGADTKTRIEKIGSLSKQLAIVEDITSPVLWTKPEDLSIAQVQTLFDAQQNPDGLLKQLGNSWSGTYTRKSWFGFLNGTIEKAYPLADPKQLEPFCLMDQQPQQSISDLKLGDVAFVERHGADNSLLGCGAILALLVLMFLPALGQRFNDFTEVFGLAFFSTGLTLAIISFLFMIAMFTTT